MRSAMILFFALLLAAPKVFASDEWEDLFAELNKDKSASETTQTSSSTSNSSSASSNVKVTPVKTAEDSADDEDPFADPTPIAKSASSMTAAKSNSVSKSPAAALVRPPAPVKSSGISDSKTRTDFLVNTETSRMDSDIESLKRRMDDLERDNRLMTERIRNLDRSVDDLKRKR